MASVIGIVVLAAVLGWGAQFDSLEPLATGLCVTIAIFAVNFAIVEYQFAPYRKLLRGMPVWQRLLSAVLLIVSLAPLFASVVSTAWGPTVVLVTLPIVSAASVTLGWLVGWASTPSALITGRASDKALDDFMTLLGNSADDEILEQQGFQLSDISDTPLHEFGTYLSPPPQADDPLQFLQGLAFESSKESDLSTFALTWDRLLDATERIESYEAKEVGKDAYKVEEAVRTHFRQPLLNVTRFLSKTDTTGTFLGVGLQRIALRIEQQAAAYLQHLEHPLFLAGVAMGS